MSDNTVVQQGNGGDEIRTDAILQPDGVTVVKAQVVKLATGPGGVDGGVITRNNPLPVIDYQSRALLEQIYFRLGEILDELREGDI